MQNKLEIQASDVSKIEKCDIIKVYKQRWIMLILFILFAISNVIQIVEFSVIADVLVEYYDVSYAAIDWTTTIAAVASVVITFPGAYVIEKWGLKKSLIIAVIGTTLGSWLKVASVHPDRFWIVILGQGVVCCFRISIFQLLPHLATAWFSSNETSFAVGCCFSGLQVGIALSSFIPPFIVSKGNVEKVTYELYIMNLTYAVFTAINVPLIIFFTSDAPPTPPSIAKQKSLEDKNAQPKTIIQSSKAILSITPFLLYLIIDSTNVGIINSLQLLSNQIILHYYPEATYDVGIIGLLQGLSSIIGSITTSIILVNFKKLKEVTWITYAAYTSSVLLLVLTLNLRIEYVYTSSILIGIVVGAMTVVGTEVIIEFTYPEPESISFGISYNLTLIISMAFTSLYGYIFRTFSITWANVTLMLLIFSTVITFFFLKFNLRRQSAENAKK